MAIDVTQLIALICINIICYLDGLKMLLRDVVTVVSIALFRVGTWQQQPGEGC
jgi:hypothetical protein